MSPNRQGAEHVSVNVQSPKALLLWRTSIIGNTNFFTGMVGYVGEYFVGSRDAHWIAGGGDRRICYLECPPLSSHSYTKVSVI